MGDTLNGLSGDDTAIALMVLIAAVWLMAGPFIGRVAMRRAGFYGPRRASAPERTGFRVALLMALVVSLGAWAMLIGMLGR